MEGLGYLLKRYVSQAQSQLRLGLRADSMRLHNGKVAVCGTLRGVGNEPFPIKASADVVILAMPAPDALQLLPDLPDHIASTMSRIEYDSRTAIAISFDSALQDAIVRRFDGLAEVALDVQAPHEVHLVSWQNMKDHSQAAHGEPVRLVVHSAAGTLLSDGRAAALRALSGMLGLSPTLLEGLVLDCKVVQWQVCQMVRPLESVPTSLQLPEPALAHGPIIIAGDFWCQSSFLGCFCSASAAVRQALAILRPT